MRSKTKTVIGLASVSKLLTIVVDSKGPGYRYRDSHLYCVNFKNDNETPSCIVGHVFYLLGFTYEDCHNESVENSVERLKTTRPEFSFTPEAVLMLAVAQSVQDSGGTWGEARNAAERVNIYLVEDRKVVEGPRLANANSRLPELRGLPAS